MAYTQEQIQDAIRVSMAQGFSPEDIAAGLYKYGVTADQTIAAVQAMNPSVYAQGSEYAGAAATGNIATGQQPTAFNDPRWQNLDALSNNTRALFDAQDGQLGNNVPTTGGLFAADANSPTGFSPDTSTSGGWTYATGTPVPTPAPVASPAPRPAGAPPAATPAPFPTLTGNVTATGGGAGGTVSVSPTSVNVPQAMQAQGTGPAPTAAPVTSAPGVQAPQGTASLYTAATAAPVAPVTAGQAQAGTVAAPTAQNTNATATGYQSTDAAAALRGNANTWTPDAKSTVGGQIADITTSGSPLMQQAEAAGLRQANKRGLLNSSMAVQAGQSALYSAALPIAQQDANTNAQAGQFNAGAANERDAQNANLGTQVNLANAGASNQAAQFTAGAQNQASQLNAQNATDTSKFNAAQGLDASKANAQLATQVSQFNVDNALKAGIINQDTAAKLAQFNATQVNAAGQANAQSANQMALANIDAALKAGIVNKQQADAMAQFAASEQNKLTALDMQLDQDIQKFNASESNKLTALGMDSATKMALAQTEASYRTLMQTSASASELYKQVMSSMANILSSKDMDAGAKASATQNLVGALNASLGIMGQIANLDLPELVFGGNGAAAPAPEAPAAPPAPTQAPGQAPAPPASLVNA